MKNGKKNTPCLALSLLVGAALLDNAAAQELGINDFRVSDMGPDGDTAFVAHNAAVAYSPAQHEYLVVWAGSDDTGSLVAGELEVFGQRIDATTGAEVGANDFRVSDMGPDGDPAFTTSLAAVAYNSTADEYFVVWQGEEDSGPLGAPQQEIHGQRIDAATGTEVGTNDFRISDMGSESGGWFGSWPDVAYNPIDDEYLVVWWGSDTTPGFGVWEIFGQRIDGTTGAEIGTNDFRISDMGPGVPPGGGGGAFTPTVVHNPNDNEYLVVWEGRDTLTAGVEIHGQRIDASTGTEVGTNDFRISDMGTDGDTSFASLVRATHNPNANEYLVVWMGADLDDGLADDEFEIFGQRIDAATGAEVGTNDFRISALGPDGDNTFQSALPVVAYNTVGDEYLVAWMGLDDGPALAIDEFEVFGQRLDGSTGAEVGHDDVRLSDMGPDGDPDFDVYGILGSAIAYNATNDEYLLVWTAEDNTGALVDEETEVFGQRIAGGDSRWLNVHHDLVGTHGQPSLVGSGTLVGGETLTLALTNVLENTTAALVVGAARLDAPFKGGTLVPDFNLGLIVFGLPTLGGGLTISGPWPAGIPSGFATYYQYWVTDPAGPAGLSASNAIEGTTP